MKLVECNSIDYDEQQYWRYWTNWEKLSTPCKVVMLLFAGNAHGENRWNQQCELYLSVMVYD